jgi:hypothetical protein
MAVGLYLDEHVPRAITAGLRSRGVDVLTVQEDGRAAAPDPEILDRAAELGRVVFTRDDDFLIEGAKRWESGAAFAGIVFAAQLEVTIGKCVADLELIAQLASLEEMQSQIVYLPL